LTAQGVSCIIRSWSRKNGGGKVKKNNNNFVTLQIVFTAIVAVILYNIFPDQMIWYWIYSFSSLLVQVALLGAVFVIAYIVLWVAHATKKKKR